MMDLAVELLELALVEMMDSEKVQQEWVLAGQPAAGTGLAWAEELALAAAAPL
jgi:hypothetical protein